MRGAVLSLPARVLRKGLYFLTLCDHSFDTAEPARGWPYSIAPRIPPGRKNGRGKKAEGRGKVKEGRGKGKRDE